MQFCLQSLEVISNVGYWRQLSQIPIEKGAEEGAVAQLFC